MVGKKKSKMCVKMKVLLRLTAELNKLMLLLQINYSMIS